LATRNTTTGATLEELILSPLRRNGYQVGSQVYVGNTPNGRRHRVDALAVSPEGKDILISVKWQQVSGTAEEKIPYEVIKLIYSIENSEGRFDKAYLVLAGNGWTLRDWYLSGELKKYITKSHLVDIVNLDGFITLANKKKL
jgi:hypothetical protein